MAPRSKVTPPSITAERNSPRSSVENSNRGARTSCCMRHTKFDPLVGVRHPSLLIEDERAGLEVDGIVRLLRWRLVGTLAALQIPLQIDVDFTRGTHVPGCRIVGEFRAVN